MSTTNVTSSRLYKGKSLLIKADKYVVLDLETTGLDPYTDKIIEMAAIKVENGIIADKFQCLVNPGFYIDPFISNLTGITNSMLKDAPHISVMLPSFLNFIGDNIVIAHNANFDVNFLYEACINLNPQVYFSNDFIDTMRLSRNLYKEYQHHRLSDLVERFSITGDVEHRALSDVLQTNQCYIYMMSFVEQNNINLKTNTSQKENFSSSPMISKDNGVFMMTCSKHTEKEAAGMCVYCGKLFCKDCLVEVNGKMYCRDDINKVFAQQQQQQSQTQQITPQYQAPPIIINNQNTNTNTNTNTGLQSNYIHKSKVTALIMCLLGLIGLCGLHRFYVGKIGTGLIWLFTLGFFGIGQFIDFIMIIAGGFRDNAGQPLK